MENISIVDFLPKRKESSGSFINKTAFGAKPADYRVSFPVPYSISMWFFMIMILDFTLSIVCVLTFLLCDDDSYKSCPSPARHFSVTGVVTVPVNCSHQTKPEPLIKSKNRTERRGYKWKGSSHYRQTE